MRNTWITLLMTLLALAAFGQEKRPLDYGRANRGNRNPPAVRQPLPLPQELMIVRTADDSRRRTASRRQAPDPLTPIYAAAEKAAEYIAADLAATFGYREYYKVGFHQALKYSLQTPSRGSRDYHEGSEAARYSPGLRAEGNQLGEEAAQNDAYEKAQATVANQFHDLSRTPQRQPVVGRFNTPNFAAHMDSYEAPSLQQVFSANPIQNFQLWNGRNTRFYENWRPDPWHLYQANAYTDCYDRNWRDPSFAFSCFRKDRRASSYYHSLPKEQRRVFKSTFMAAYENCLVPHFARYNQVAHLEGWNDGCHYGAFINSEWHYRKGYFDGASNTLNNAASDAYSRTYAQTYRNNYQDTFDQWSNHAVVELENIRMVDASGDGIFEPGEALSVRADMVNYGGTGDTLSFALYGQVFENESRSQVRVAARSRKETGRALRATIAADTRAKQLYTIRLQLGEYFEELDLNVSWPVILEPEPRLLSRDNLRGSAEVELTLFNKSRAAVSGATITYNEEVRLLGTIAAGARVKESFQLRDANRLDMLAGQAGFRSQLKVGRKVWDSLDFRFPDQVRDLNNGDLLQILLDLAESRSLDRNEVRRAQEMWLIRMEADWQAVSADNGNNYKQDYRHGGGRTALGRLVEAYRNNKSRMKHPEVFTELRADLLSLSKRLPGSHPFLRKQYRKLTGKLQ